MDKLTLQISAELYRALEAIGSKSDLLSIVGSWGDSLSDEQVLSMLRAWNATTAHTEPA
jgi:hypothetical protein